MPRFNDKGRSDIQHYCKGRAAKAARLLKAYDAQDIETSVGDCLADLMHLCEARGYDFLTQYEKGRTHFNAELTGGEHGE